MYNLNNNKEYKDEVKSYVFNSMGGPGNIYGSSTYHRQGYESKENDNLRRTTDNKRKQLPLDQWNGIVGDLVSGSADMSFTALSVSK